jgi:lipopolysaccharide transport system permease protein
LKINSTLYQYRELVRNLAIADLKNHYQNTSLGLFWSVLSPLLLTFILYFVFRQVFGREENFAVNLIVGIMVWRFFSTGTTACLNSIVTKPNLVTKVYIPRQILVFSTALSCLISSLLEFVILFPIAYLLLGHLPLTIVLYPLAHILLFLPIYGIGLLWASVFVFFRDLTQIWEVLLSVLIYTSPIIYPISIVPPYLLKYYMLNPLTHIIIIYRDIMVNGKFPTLSSLLIVLAFGIGAFLIGNMAFNKLQRRFAEEL